MEHDCPLAEVDPELFDIIEHEKCRQQGVIQLIASQKIIPRAVIDSLDSCLTNKYSEGFTQKPYQGVNEQIEKIQSLVQKRTLQAFRLNLAEWSVNIQPYSGFPANFVVYTGLLNPHDRIMGLGLSQ